MNHKKNFAYKFSFLVLRILFVLVGWIRIVNGMSLSCLYITCKSCEGYLFPQCGSNGITYPNPCWIDCYNNNEDCGGAGRNHRVWITSPGWCPMTVRPKRRGYIIVTRRSSTSFTTSIRITSTSTTEKITSTSENIGQVCNISLCNCRQHYYNPVCGSDGITYSNTCYFSCARRCFIDLEFVKCGLCSWTSQPTRSCLGRLTHEIIRSTVSPNNGSWNVS